MNKKFATIIICFFTFVLLTGCTLPSGTATPIPLPICPTEDLQQVTLTSPAMVSIIDTLNPGLEWTYPSTECTPEGYAITLWEGPLLTTNLGGGTGNPSTIWGPGSPLQPGKQYRWTVAPINGTTLGPASTTGIFFTGPVCDPGALVAPILLEPADGASFNEATDLLWWNYTAGCTPTGYRVDLAEDPAFATVDINEFDIPLTRMLPGALTECEIYYWRVAAKSGATLGPFSETRSFIRDASGTCAGPGGSPPPSASIGGIVWHDLCAVPDGPAPATPPTGCIEEGGSLRANGIREPGEPGIAGIKVDLHFGGCATEPVASVLTDADGQYVFDGILAFGNYCVAVRAATPPNDAILIPGGWTYPPGIFGADAFANATVDSGDILNDRDFGWDYQFLPVAGAATEVPTAVAASEPPQFKFDKNAFCRKGPGTVYSEVTAIPAGDIVNVLGTSSDNLWLYILWPKFNAQCWVAASTGQPISSLVNIPIFTPAPTPQPTAIPVKPSPTPTLQQGKP